MNVQNLEFVAFLCFDVVTIERNTLLPSVSPAYKSVFEELGRALSDPRLHCRLDSVIVFKPLASQRVLKRSKHVKMWWGQIGAVRWMGQYSPPPCSNRSCGGVCSVGSQTVEYPRSLMMLWTDPWLTPITSMILLVVTRQSLRISSTRCLFASVMCSRWRPTRTWLVDNVSSATLKLSYPSPNSRITKRRFPINVP